MNVNVEFRTQSRTIQSKCKCGRPTTTWLTSERQYRVKHGGKWSPWRKVPEAEMLLQKQFNRQAAR